MSISAVETLHSMWLDECTMHRLLDRANGRTPIKGCARYARSQAHLWANSSRLRSFILAHQKDDRVELGDEFAKLFLQTEYPPEGFPSAIYSAPLVLANWRWQSGRVYNIDADLQEVLEQTSIDRFIWNELCLPFHAYAVHCATPLQDDDGRSYRDLILSEVETVEGKEVVIWLVPEHYAKVSSLKMQTIEACIRRDDPDAMRKKALFIANELERAGGVPFIFNGKYSVKQIVGVRDKRQKLWQQVLRIVGGLAVYLETLPANSTHVKPNREATRQSKDSTSVVRVISDQAEVFDVTLSIEIKTLISPPESSDGTCSRKGVSPSPHWREAYWRRSPGMGNDPTARKTVHVRRTLVLSERLPHGALLVATCKKLC